MKLFAALALFSSLAACSDPQFGANFGFGSDGVAFSPSLSGRLGDAHVMISG